jgi:hypothetical protein
VSSEIFNYALSNGIVDLTLERFVMDNSQVSKNVYTVIIVIYIYIHTYIYLSSIWLYDVLIWADVIIGVSCIREELASFACCCKQENRRLQGPQSTSTI